MGGEREAYLESAEKVKKKEAEEDLGTMGSVGSTSGNRIRIHESAGEVHFHDDTTKLKTAVPVSAWWKAWDKLSSQPQSWQYTDNKNKSVLTVETKWMDNGALDAIITLAPLTIGTNFSELAKFTTRK